MGADLTPNPLSLDRLRKTDWLERSSREGAFGARILSGNRGLKPPRLTSLASIESTLRPLLGHQQVTDAYLVAVAEANDATLLTLDQRLVATGIARDRVEALAL